MRANFRQFSVNLLSLSALLFFVTAPLQLGATSNLAWACDGHCEHSKKCKDCHEDGDQASAEGTKDTAKAKKKSCNCKTDKKGA